MGKADRGRKMVGRKMVGQWTILGSRFWIFDLGYQLMALATGIGAGWWRDPKSIAGQGLQEPGQEPGPLQPLWAKWAALSQKDREER
jgi:hypothetical protein